MLKKFLEHHYKNINEKIDSQFKQNTKFFQENCAAIQSNKTSIHNSRTELKFIWDSLQQRLQHPVMGINMGMNQVPVQQFVQQNFQYRDIS